MHNRAVAIIAGFISLVAAYRAAAVPDQLLRTLDDDGEVTNFYSDAVRVDLAPSHALTTELVRELSVLEPDVGIEALFRYEIPRAVPLEDDIDRYIYNVMRSFRTMEGIPYYSASRGRMRTFFHESYVVDNAETLTPQPDPVVDTIPARDQLTIFQRDSSFGRNTLAVEYQAGNREVMLSMVNLTTMAYRGVLPVVRPENLRMFLYVVREGRSIYFYGNCGVRTFSMFGMEDRAQASFTNRIRALYAWFAERMEEYS